MPSAPSAGAAKSTRKGGAAVFPKPGYYTGIPDNQLPGSAGKQWSASKKAQGGSAPDLQRLGRAHATATDHTVDLGSYAKLKLTIEQGLEAGPIAFRAGYARQMELGKERKRLHDESVSMVAKWNNTIAGQRKARLAAQEEKARMAEEERKQMDREWESVKQAERQAMIERAKQMQYLEDVRVRQLNSQALITQVLKERKAQVEYKSAADQEARVKSREFHEQELAQLAAADRSVESAAARARNSRHAMAVANRHMADEQRAAQAHAGAEMREWFRREAEAGALEARSQEAARAQNKSSQAKAIVQELDSAVREKQDRARLVHDQDVEQDRINNSIVQIKADIAQRRKETENSMIKSRVERNEHVAQAQAHIAHTLYDNRTAYLEKLQHAHEGEQEVRLQAEAERRKRGMMECVASIQQECKGHEQVRLQERLEAAEVRKHNESVARAAVKSAEVRRERLRNAQQTFGQVYRQEITRHQEVSKQAKEVLNHQCKLEHDRQVELDNNFRQYAQHLVRDLRAIGNDPLPVQKKFTEMELDPRSKNHFTDREVDTFYRLGFN